MDFELNRSDFIKLRDGQLGAAMLWLGDIIDHLNTSPHCNEDNCGAVDYYWGKLCMRTNMATSWAKRIDG